jgi:hypothetical protein
MRPAHGFTQRPEPVDPLGHTVERFAPEKSCTSASARCGRRVTPVVCARYF